ncbi:MAG: YceI family protein [Bacteroidota bacterium]|nr:YceI family protein [Bacteroidota bacterium]
MKYSTLVILLNCGLLGLSCKNKSASDTSETGISLETKVLSNTTRYFADSAQCIVYWLGSKATGGKHNGSIHISEGYALVSDNLIQSGDFIIDMKSIKNLDLESGDGKEDLEEHLKSADFFNVDSFPYASFSLNTIAPELDSLGQQTVHGTLRIKNKENPISFKAVTSYSNNMIMLSIPEFILDRTEWGIMYNSKKLLNKLKDKFIDDEMIISMKIVLKPSSN